ncbi:MAG: hypothetical protein QGI05_03645, partial [Candidatus Omnitrophota bacterium]|nr:hypothetical protein [Candidatus Omnitrophota bacterium]
GSIRRYGNELSLTLHRLLFTTRQNKQRKLLRVLRHEIAHVREGSLGPGISQEERDLVEGAVLIDELQSMLEAGNIDKDAGDFVQDFEDLEGMETVRTDRDLKRSIESLRILYEKLRVQRAITDDVLAHLVEEVLMEGKDGDYRELTEKLQEKLIERLREGVDALPGLEGVRSRTDI